MAVKVDPNDPSTWPATAETGAPGFFTPPPGMDKTTFQNWLKQAAGADQTVPTQDPEQAWTDYQAGNFSLGASRVGSGAAVDVPWWQDVSSFPVGGGIAGLIAGALTHPADPVDAAQKAAAAQPQQTTQPSAQPPGYTEANLRAYTSDYLMPALSALRTAQDQDLMQWKSFLNQESAKHPSNAIAQILQQEYNAQAPLYDQMMNNAQWQLITQPYLDLNNKFLAAQAAEGGKALAQSASLQMLLPYLAQSGQLSQFTAPTAPNAAPTGTNTQSLVPGMGGYGIGNIPTTPGG